ncbi:MAG: DUF3365 domain-containing protein [Gammaproteobacteria bacterium]|nr:DUF3365 domain-containing protein [Gammaproteobacteria bacterium]
MKRNLIAVLLLSGILGSANAAESDENVTAARKLVKGFFGELKGELQTAMKAGGPVAAIAACNGKAPLIAHDLAQRSGWDVGRTSLKLRQPKNRPDAWETAGLKSFEARKAAGENIKTMEQSETTEVAGKKTFRYMKAIPTAKLCLTCHGTDIKPEVNEALQKLYPEDQAVGYTEGEIRGAFTFSKTL